MTVPMLPPARMLADSGVFASEYTNSSVVHPLGVVATVFAIGGVLVAGRAWIPAIVILLSWIVVPAQRIIIGGFDLSFYRLIAGVAVIVLCGQCRPLKSWRGCDQLVVLFLSFLLAATVVRGAVFSLAAGQVLDFGLFYLVGRLGIRSWGDWHRFLICLAIASSVALVPLAVEKLTGRNPFFVFGGVPEVTPWRSGKLRVQGAFVHPIMGGMVFASLAPAFLCLSAGKVRRGHRAILCVGGICASINAMLVASSTPMGSLLVSIGVLLLYRYRQAFGQAAIAMVLVGGVIHVFSTSGLHHLLFARTTIVSGSTGYHRYLLWDAAINRFAEWAPIGVNSTSHWGWGLNDVTCEYIAVGVRGGVLALAFFLVLLWRLFKGSWKASCLDTGGASRAAYSLFLFLLSMAVGFTGVTLFGQASQIFSFGLGASVSLLAAEQGLLKAVAYKRSHLGAPLVLAHHSGDIRPGSSEFARGQISTRANSAG